MFYLNCFQLDATISRVLQWCGRLNGGIGVEILLAGSAGGRCGRQVGAVDVEVLTAGRRRRVETCVACTRRPPV